MNVAENIIKKNTNNINTEDVDIIPCNLSVLVKFYDENPYRKVEQTSTGLYVGIESTKKYKSNETGEMETNEEVIACAKVIAVGPKCENVKVGEDVFVVKYICNPVPFRKMGYYMVSESNIMCRIVKRD